MDLDINITKCTKCDLYKTCKQPISWDWNFNSKILFIGEAPWANEDDLWKPFIWRSWKLLTWILEWIWLKRNKDYYITNIVKCRPPKNRDPLKSEIEICSSYLLNQIKLWDFKTIVTLWRFSMNFFMPNLAISKNRWKLFKITEFKNIKFKNWLNLFPSYHPAAALYSPSKKDIIINDLKKIKAL